MAIIVIFAAQLTLMRRIILLILALLPFCSVRQGVCAPSADSLPHPSMEEVYRATRGDGDSMRAYLYHVMKEYDYNATLDCSKQLYRIGKKYGDEKNVVYGAAMAGNSYVFLRNRDSAYVYLRESVNVGEKIDFQWGLASAYNGMGIYQLNFGDSDYYDALQFFSKSIEAARKGKNEQTYAVALCNIATVYFLRGDADGGLPYVQESYQLGLELDDEYLKFAGSHMLATMHYIKGNYDKALETITVCEGMVTYDKDASPLKAVKVFTLYGNILAARGEYTKAEQYFNRALALKNDLYGDLLDYTYLSYGQYFLSRNRYGEALAMFREGVELAALMDNKVYLNQYYQMISECYEKLGSYSHALQYYKSYYDLSMNIFSAQKERSVSEMRVQYEVEKKEAEIARNHLQLVQQKRKAQVYGLILAMILLALGAAFYYYYRKNKFYREIFRQSQLAIKARTKLESQQYNSQSATQSAKYAFSPLSDERGRELFEQLENLMVTKKLYLDGKLTVDELAKEIGSNRSYLSRIINEHSGYNFNNFVNSYRINEAVRILSGPDGDIPLKALAIELGFNTISTFYSSFQKEIGMTPSRYRKMVVDNLRAGGINI